MRRLQALFKAVTTKHPQGIQFLNYSSGKECKKDKSSSSGDFWAKVRLITYKKPAKMSILFQGEEDVKKLKMHLNEIKKKREKRCKADSCKNN